MKDWIDRRFELSAHGTTVRTEVVGGITTFATMAYILLVQPIVLSAAGMDPGAVLTATCIASAIGCTLMALLANYPIALAPAMGHNFFFTYAVVLGEGVPWTTALGAIAISGTLFVLLAGVGLREALIEAIPMSLKRAIGVGIGLLITLVGLQYGGIVRDHPGTLVSLGSLRSAPELLTLAGLTLTVVLLVRGVRGAILIGILATTVLSVVTGTRDLEAFELVAMPPSLAPTFLAFDPLAALQLAFLPVIFVFLFLDLFDTVGTLVGVSEKAGLMDEQGRLPKARQALLADALSTVAGAALGTTTVTSYIESASGISAGARTGLASLVTAALFLLALFFTPLVSIVSGGVLVDGQVFYPTIAPALIVVGFFMVQSVAGIDWQDPTEGLPAFLAIIVMPMSFSITDGIAFGFISYVIAKLAAGRAREAHPLLYVFAALFLLRYIFLDF